jgi:23S rRNA (uracil1939-C5)-methyltransferase
LPHRDTLIKRLVGKFPQIVSIVHNLNPDKTNVILGKTSLPIFGEDFIRDELLGISYQISHRSFYQVNPAQTEELYKKAMEYADLKATDVVIDAYCGIGTIGLSASRYVKTVLGVDVVESAIEDAKENAERNHITNARFVAGKAEDVIQQWRQYDVDVLFVDPPRKGCERSFLDAIVAMEIPRLVYISCNVSTLARDLNFLQSEGYEVIETTPFDMFPQTSHIETVTKLRRKRQD